MVKICGGESLGCVEGSLGCVEGSLGCVEGSLPQPPAVCGHDEAIK